MVSNTQRYNAIYKIVEKYDPMGIANVADDEYEPEVIEIVNRAIILDEEKLTEHIYNVFKYWFGISDREHYNEMFNQMAKEIKLYLQTND